MIYPAAIAFETGRRNQLCIVPTLVEAVSREEAIGIATELAKSAMAKDRELVKLHSINIGNDVVFRAGEEVRQVSNTAG